MRFKNTQMRSEVGFDVSFSNNEPSLQHVLMSSRPVATPCSCRQPCSARALRKLLRTLPTHTCSPGDSRRGRVRGPCHGPWLVHCRPCVLGRPSQGQEDSILRFLLDPPFLWDRCCCDSTRRGESTELRRRPVPH